jgi:hypothetical protein
MGRRRHAYRSHRELLDFYERQARAINLVGGLWQCPYCKETPLRVRPHLQDHHALDATPPYSWELATEQAASLQGGMTLTLESRLSPPEHAGFSSAEIRAGKWTYKNARPFDALAVWIAEHIDRLVGLGLPVRVLLWPAGKGFKYRPSMDGSIMIQPDLVRVLDALNVDAPTYAPWMENLDAWLAETEREQAGRAA